jgi:hypothetical protein
MAKAAERAKNQQRNEKIAMPFHDHTFSPF